MFYFNPVDKIYLLLFLSNYFIAGSILISFFFHLTNWWLLKQIKEKLENCKKKIHPRYKNKPTTVRVILFFLSPFPLLIVLFKLAWSDKTSCENSLSEKQYPHYLYGHIIGRKQSKRIRYISTKQDVPCANRFFFLGKLNIYGTKSKL